MLQSNISNNKSYFFIMGAGCSGNSAITDWMFDNLPNEYSVYCGDFEEIRIPGGLIDLAEDPIMFNRIRFNVVIRNIIHTLRVITRNFLYHIGIKDKAAPRLEIRHSIYRYFRLYVLGVLSIIYVNNQKKRQRLCLNHLNSVSKKKYIVLNNPLYYDTRSINFLRSLNINPVFIFTMRSFSTQYPEWLSLDFRFIDIPSIKSIEEKYSGIQRFFYHQEYIYKFQKKYNMYYQCFFVTFEKFVSYKQYRRKLLKNLCGLNLTKEKNKRFVAIESIKNVVQRNEKFYLNHDGIELHYLQKKFDRLDNV